MHIYMFILYADRFVQTFRVDYLSVADTRARETRGNLVDRWYRASHTASILIYFAEQQICVQNVGPVRLGRSRIFYTIFY